MTLVCGLKQVYGQTRYFIGTYVTPINIQNIAYPIDECINYEITYDIEAGDIYFYGKFTCNDAGNEITFTVFNNDDTCNTQGVIVGNYTMDSKVPGDLASFNCIGKDNYVQILEYENNDLCCGDVAKNILYATDVCFHYIDDLYSMYVNIIIF